MSPDDDKIWEELEAYRYRRLSPKAVLRNDEEREAHRQILSNVKEACAHAAMLGKEDCVYYVDSTNPRIAHALILSLKEGGVDCSLQDLRACHLGFLLRIHFFKQKDRSDKIGRIILGMLALVFLAVLHLVWV